MKFNNKMEYKEIFYEYFDIKNNKFKILKVFFKENQNQNIYNHIKKNADKRFLYNGDIHYPVYKNIDIVIPLLIEDNKVRIRGVNKNIQKIINDFLSKSLKNKNKKINNFLQFYYPENENIIVTNKYDINGNIIKNKYYLYQDEGNGYLLKDIYYTIEEYNYRHHHYIIVTYIKKIIQIYLLMLLLVIAFFSYFSIIFP